MTNFIPYGRQDVSEEDITSVVKALKSDFLTQGPLVPEFEKKISEFCGAEFAVATNSATSALHIACLSLGVGTGDMVWTSAITFVASANCALYCGAKVDFLDVNPDTYNICIDGLKKKLLFAKKTNSLPKVIIPVHLAGQSCDMAEIYELAIKYNFKIIEDASHAIGGHYKNKPIGGCEFSDITVFSFHPVKIITSGEGGMAVTNSSTLASKMNFFRSHGITKESSKFKISSPGPWYYEQQDLGFNYRMNDIEAALGISQLSKLETFINKRQEIAKYYNNRLAKLPLNLPFQKKETYSSYHLYIICIDNNRTNIDHATAFNFLRKSNIGVNLHYIPVYRHPYFDTHGFDEKNFPVSEHYYKSAISLPIFSSITRDEQDYVIDILTKIFK